MTVLIADDDDVSRLKLERLLTRWGYEVVSAKDGTEAMQILQQAKAPSLAILDWMMPGQSGVAICQKLRQAHAMPYVYVILLTSHADKQHVIAGIEAGADDYVTKPFDADELRVRVRAGQRIVELQEQLRIQATHDALTGIWNRGATLEMLEQSLVRARREGTWVGILLADLDHFKQINDTYGHLAGDEVLREAARRMASVLRPYDVLGRYGGEEFVIILPGCGPDAIEGLGERLRCCLAATAVTMPAGSISFTASIGAATTGGKDTVETSALLRAADEALYHAKRAGRNRVAVAVLERQPLEEVPR